MLSAQFETRSSAAAWNLYLDTDGGAALDAGTMASDPRPQHHYGWLSWFALSRGYLIAPAAFAAVGGEWCDAMEQSCADAHYADSYCTPYE